MNVWYKIITKYNTNDNNQLSLLQTVPSCSQITHKPKYNTPHYSWASAEMSALETRVLGAYS